MKAEETITANKNAAELEKSTALILSLREKNATSNKKIASLQQQLDTTTQERDNLFAIVVSGTYFIQYTTGPTDYT